MNEPVVREHPPRRPCDAYGYANVLAISYRNRYRIGMPAELILQELLALMDNLIYKTALRLRQVRGAGCSLEDSYGEVVSRLFELLIAFDPEGYQQSTASQVPICVTTYLKRKLTAWVTWESMRGRHVRGEQIQIWVPEVLDKLAEGQVAECWRPSLAEIRQEMSNYSDRTRDLLFFHHVLKLTQAEMAEVMGITQWAVGLQLREVQNLLRAKLPEEPVATCES